MTPGVVLTIAGSDPTAGAGIQADLKTFAAYRLYGCSVITAVTSQNTRGVDDVFPVPATVVGTQLAAVLSDFRPAAVKVGMLATAEIAAVVAAKAREGALPNLVLDPVLSSSSGFRLGVTAAVKRLLPYATVITPNRDEASALLGWQVASPADMGLVVDVQWRERYVHRTNHPEDDAEKVIKRIEGVERVENHIEVLPTSPNDDRLRRDLFIAIYRYGPLQHYGVGSNRPIRIIVNHGNVTLEGVVDRESDKNMAGLRANGVPGVFSVRNNLVVLGKEK